ncbi:MAG: hypothetical protein F6J97_23680, partial [Leptolyngbya sp. SIO4C1]|nr:hypothetical protein [Leptolyngbya sp. SIO4C1]
MMLSHVINQVSLEIATGNLGDVSSLQEDLSRLLWHQAFPRMEQLFDQLIPADEVVRLDQVVLNLPRLDPHDAAQDFVPQLMAALELSLADYLAGYRPAEVTATTAHQSPTKSDWESLRYFLEYGRLPWWSATTSWESRLARWQTALEADSSCQEPLRSLLATNANAIQRLTSQFPESLQHQLVLQLQPTWTVWRALLQQSHQLVEVLALSDRASATLNRQAWLVIFTLLSTASPYSSLPKVLWLAKWLPELVKAVRAELRSRGRQAGIPRHWLTFLAPDLTEFSRIEIIRFESTLFDKSTSPTELRRLLSGLIAQTITVDISVWQAAIAQVLSSTSSAPPLDPTTATPEDAAPLTSAANTPPTRKQLLAQYQAEQEQSAIAPATPTPTS